MRIFILLADIEVNGTIVAKSGTSGGKCRGIRALGQLLQILAGTKVRTLFASFFNFSLMLRSQLVALLGQVIIRFLVFRQLDTFGV